MSINEYLKAQPTLPDYDITLGALANRQLSINISIDV